MGRFILVGCWLASSSVIGRVVTTAEGVDHVRYVFVEPFFYSPSGFANVDFLTAAWNAVNSRILEWW